RTAAGWSDRSPGPEGVEKQPEGRHDPRQGLRQHGNVKAGARDVRRQPLGPSGPRGRGPGWRGGWRCRGGDAHRLASTALNWRRLKINTGTTASSRITARALALA